MAAVTSRCSWSLASGSDAISLSAASRWRAAVIAFSMARAIAVVKFLIDQGIPANRLVAAGYAEFQPLVQGDDDEAYRRNRRIELKLDQR